jgi:Ricin-type beta-trefoil lectin domain-like
MAGGLGTLECFANGRRDPDHSNFRSPAYAGERERRGKMNGIAYSIGRVAIAVAAAMAASLSFAGEARAQFRGPGVYVIKVGFTGDVLDVDSTWGHGGDPNQRLLRWGDNGGTNQKFIIFAAERGGYIIRALHSLYCLDIPNGRIVAGADVIQYYCNGADSQRFEISPNGATTVIRTSTGNKIFYARSEGQRVELGTPVIPTLSGMQFYFERK